MRVSVAMATYNGERFIREQLDSLARQTLLPHELVVSDDGSTDETLEIIEKFRTSAPFPVVLNRNADNLGYALNFMKAAELCSGEALAFCDQDDVWLPRKLERCAAVLEDQGVLLVLHSAEVIDERGVRLGGRVPVRKRRGALLGKIVYPCGWGMVFKRRVFDEAWRVGPRGLFTALSKEQRDFVGHDTLMFWVANGLGNVHFQDEVLVLYRVHAHNRCASEGDFGRWSHLRAWCARLRFSAAHLGSPIAAEYRRKATTYDCRARLVAGLREGGRLAALEALARNLRDRAANMQRRSELYESAGLRYWTRYVRMLGRGCYRSESKGGLGLRCAVKDLVAGGVRLVGQA